MRAGVATNFVKDVSKELGELTAEAKTRYRDASGAELDSLREDFIIPRPRHRHVDRSKKQRVVDR
jgi:hypothetical protein